MDESSFAESKAVVSFTNEFMILPCLGEFIALSVHAQPIYRLRTTLISSTYNHGSNTSGLHLHEQEQYIQDA